MKKQMNLIPLEVKQKRKNEKYKKIALASSLIPIAILGQSYLSINMMEKKVKELGENINAAKELEGQIAIEQKNIEKNNTIIGNLTNGGLPLNRFLLFTGVNLPSDVRLYSVKSKSLIMEEEEAEKTVSEEKAPVEIDAEVSSEGQVEGETDGEKEKLEDIKIEKTTNDISIKGAALNVESVGTFMTKMQKDNPYIKSVDIVDIQNYYNGSFNYKLFELVVEMKY